MNPAEYHNSKCFGIKKEKITAILGHMNKRFMLFVGVTFGPSYYKNVDMVKEIKFIGIKLQVEQ